MKIGEQICAEIEQSVFFDKFVLKHGYMCDGTCYTYPIQDWVSDKRIDIHINSLVSHNGMTNSFKKLYKDLLKKFKLVQWWYNKNDGSCPQVYTIFYE